MLAMRQALPSYYGIRHDQVRASPRVSRQRKQAAQPTPIVTESMTERRGPHDQSLGRPGKRGTKIPEHGLLKLADGLLDSHTLRHQVEINTLSEVQPAPRAVSEAAQRMLAITLGTRQERYADNGPTAAGASGHIPQRLEISIRSQHLGGGHGDPPLGVHDPTGSPNPKSMLQLYQTETLPHGPAFANAASRKATGTASGRAATRYRAGGRGRGSRRGAS
jgi:hypothetical protein